jgi:hypothetical protein
VGCRRRYVGDISSHPYNRNAVSGCSHDTGCCYLRPTGSEPHRPLQSDNGTPGNVPHLCTCEI